MAMEKLSEVDPPFGRVPGQDLLKTPVMKWQQRNREGIGKNGSAPRVFGARGKYRRRGAARGPPGSPGAPWARPHPRPLVALLGSPLDYSGSFRSANSLYICPGIYLVL